MVSIIDTHALSNLKKIAKLLSNIITISMHHNSQIIRDSSMRLNRRPVNTYTTQWAGLKRYPPPHYSWPGGNTCQHPFSLHLGLAESPVCRLGEIFDFHHHLHHHHLQSGPTKLHPWSTEEYRGKGDPRGQRWRLHRTPQRQCSFEVNGLLEELQGKKTAKWLQ